MGNEQSISACIVYSTKINNVLKADSRLAQFKFYRKDPKCYAFRVGFPNTSSICKGAPTISISVPPDAYGNRGDEYDEGEPTTIETALVKDGSLVYIDSVGYFDVLRFDTIDDLIAELLRLSSIVYNPSTDDDDSNDDDSDDNDGDENDDGDDNDDDDDDDNDDNDGDNDDDGDD
jgi:hypothetical protein